MHSLKAYITILLALTLSCLPAQAESQFTRLLKDLKKKGKAFIEDIVDKAQESLENGRLFDLTNCDQATIEDALVYARIIEANANNNSEQADLEGYNIIDLSTLGDPQASEEALFAFAAKLNIDENIRLEELPNTVIQALEHVANEHPETFLQHFFVEYDHKRDIYSHTLEGFGVKARLYQPKDSTRLILAFRGTESDSSNYIERQWFNIGTDLWQGLGECSIAYEFAYCLGLALTQAFPDYTIEFTGISLGGGLAHYSASMLHTKAVCFNDPNLGQCALTRIYGQSDRDHFDLEQLIQHIHIEGEILNTLMPIAPGKKLGNQCDVPPYHDGLNPIARHHTEHLVSSLTEYLHDFAL